MPLPAKALRTQLAMLRPVVRNMSLKSVRKWQNVIGGLMEARYKDQIIVKKHDFGRFSGAWVMPGDERRQGAILYLHGGGYTCGDLEYAMGFGAMLAVQNGVRVFCAAYRLAPEHPFPAAVDDAVEAYRYMLNKGYAPERITLCGESAGGGLCFALCMKLQQLGIALPCGIIAISPWTDMTQSGPSYEENRHIDPSMTAEALHFYADSYVDDRLDPLASPLFGDLSQMPPALIYVGSDEIMRSDAETMHDRLLRAGRKSQLVIGEDRWHGYLLYGLEEDRKDFDTMNRFLDRYMVRASKLRWVKLDNAAKIYPAAQRRNWSNVFRLSITLKEKVDAAVLQSALDVTVRRFPAMAARLRKGVFWYYLQELAHAPAVQEEYAYPLTRMTRQDIRKCAFRVIVYENRIAAEFFHALTDGNGGLVFLKSLTAEYLQQKYGVYIPAEHGVLGRLEEPSPDELEDSFQKYSGPMSLPRAERTAWRLSGTPEKDGFFHVTCLKLPVKDVLALAKAHGLTLTAFLATSMMMALQNYQKELFPDQRKRLPIKVLIPVNLRRLFPSKTLRNFVLFTTPEILPRLGEYEFDEVAKIVHHHMGADITPKRMSMKIATNVGSERNPIVKAMPLFVKNFVMKMVFDAVGECKSCLSISNLGQVKLPEAMLPYVERLDFILGVQASAPSNVGVLSYGDSLYINMIRNIQESNLELHFYRVLRDMGLSVEVQSNTREVP